MSIAYTWEELYKNRLNWAFTARNNFIRSISDNDIHKAIALSQSKETIISVYGKPQVGKTSLILKIIGIKDEYIFSLSRILRGNRLIGDSSTSTATIYKASIDNNFWVKSNINDMKSFDESGLKNCLDSIRNKIESEACEYIEKIEIYIPLIYFCEKKSNEFIDMNIIDLPGIDSSSSKEHSHVNSTIKKFIPISSLVIIVEAANDIARLKRLCFPDIKHWSYYPDFFRIVLTHSVSARSTKSEIKNCSEFNVSFFRSIFIRELSLTLDTFFNNEMQVYPLEYGESWTQLKEKDNDVFEKTNVFIDLVFDELLEDIQNSVSDYNQLIISAKIYKTISHLQQDKLENFRISIETKKKEEERFHKQIESIKRIKLNLIKRMEKYEANISIFKDFELNIAAHNYKGEKNRKSLTHYIRKEILRYEEEVKKEVNKYLSNKPSIINELELIQEARKICKMKTKSFIDIQDKHLIDIYFDKLPFSKWDNDLNKCNQLLSQICSEINEKITRMVDNKIDNYITENNKLHKINNGKLVFFDKIFDNIVNDNELIRIEIKQMNKEMILYKEASIRDLETAQRFKEFLTKSFSDEYIQVIQKINSPNVDVEYKCIYLAYLKIINEEFEKLEAVM
ncbi:hypothetical protein [Acetoanaerobium sticklandii]|uniref:hypothetical protein n=1 Tax=Acetoanaerobium sticklandii TaxID=1511 RepID=UPI003A9486F1